MNQTQVDILRLLKSEPASPAQLLNAIGIPAVTASVDIRQLSDLGFIRRVSSSSGYLYLITKTGKHALYYAEQEAEALRTAKLEADERATRDVQNFNDIKSQLAEVRSAVQGLKTQAELDAVSARKQHDDDLASTQKSDRIARFGIWTAVVIGVLQIITSNWSSIYAIILRVFSLFSCT